MTKKRERKGRIEAVDSNILMIDMVYVYTVIVRYSTIGSSYI